MTSEERWNAAINFEKLDRVPICPLISVSAAAGILGNILGELHREPMKALEAQLELFDTFGGWDGINLLPNTRLFYNLGGFKVEVPGIDLPDNYQIQFDEKEWMTIEDYKIIARIGWRTYFKYWL